MRRADSLDKMGKADSLEKTLVENLSLVGKNRGQEEKQAPENEMIR